VRCLFIPEDLSCCIAGGLMRVVPR